MSAQVLKQMKIKTSTLRRLKKQYLSYEKETKTISEKIETLQNNQGNQEDLQIEIKKHKEFLTESQTVLSNVKQKLIQAFEALASFLSQKSNDENLEGTQEKKQAQEVVLSAETFLQNLQ